MDDIALRRRALAATILEASDVRTGNCTFVITRSGPEQGTATACVAAAAILGIAFECISPDGSSGACGAPAVLLAIGGMGSGVTVMARGMTSAPKGTIVVLGVPGDEDLADVARHIEDATRSATLIRPS